MKNIFKSKSALLLAGVLGASVMSTSAMAEFGDTTVEIQNQAITLASVSPLDFGTILPYGRNGTVTVNYNGTTSTSNTYEVAPGSPATWAVTGVNSAPYAISLPAAGSVTLTNITSGNSELMTVNSFHSTGGTTQQYLDAAGVDTFNVGGVLAVGANQPAGTYTGTYEVTVSYN